MQSAARIICLPMADKFHTCILRSVFVHVHAAAENDLRFIRRFGGELCEAFCVQHRYHKYAHPNLLLEEEPLSVEQQADPGNHIGTELEFQTSLLQHIHHVDAVALHAGVHLLREPAGLTV